MNHHGEVIPPRSKPGVGDNNLFPLCYRDEPPASGTSLTTEEIVHEKAGRPVPKCPQAWLDEKDEAGKLKWKLEVKVVEGSTTHRVLVERNKWLARGAMNAGMAVFVYLQDLLIGDNKGKPPTPEFDKCEDLGK